MNCSRAELYSLVYFKCYASVHGGPSKYDPNLQNAGSGKCGIEYVQENYNRSSYSNCANLLESTVKSIKENPVGGGSLSMLTHTSTKTLFSRPYKQKRNL